MTMHTPHRAASPLRERGLRIAAMLGLAGCLLLPATSQAHPSPSHSLDEINEHLEEKPNDPTLLRSKAQILVVMGKLAEAQDISRQLLQADPKSPDNQLLAARLILLEGDTGPALAQAEKITKTTPEFAPGWDFLANLLYKTGRRDKAITAKLKYIELSKSENPSDYLTAAGWLRGRNKAGDAQAAIAVLDQGMARIGVLSGLQQQAIEIDLSLKQWDSALRRVDVLTARMRPSADFATQRAEILMQAGRYAEAAGAYDAAIAMLKASPSWKRDPAALKQRLASLVEKKEAAQAGSAQAAAR